MPVGRGGALEGKMEGKGDGGKGWMEYEEKEKSIGEWEVRWMDIYRKK